MINGLLFKQMLESGANHLTNKFTEIDALNVFPVPDGDTGTNLLYFFHVVRGIDDGRPLFVQFQDAF